jgi:hypothetical protein
VSSGQFFLKCIERYRAETLIECLGDNFVTALHARPLKKVIARLAQSDAFTGWGGRSRPGVPGCRHHGFQRLNPLRREIGPLLAPDFGGGDLGELTAARAGGDTVDLFRRRRATVLFLKEGDLLLDLRPSFRRHGAVLGRHAEDLESFDDAVIVARRFDFVTGREHALSEFVLVDFARVADRREHFALGERKPLVGFGVEGGVGCHKVGVQMCVEGA